MTKKFYIYCFFRPWDGTPCYIGKGKGNRWMDHAKQLDRHPNKYLARIITKANANLPVVFIHQGLDERTAYEYEKALILAIGRKCDGGPLVNITSGGEGFSGLSHSIETRRKMSAAQTGKSPTEAHRKAISIAKKGKTFFSSETIEKMRLAKLGCTPWNKGILIKKAKPIKTPMSKFEICSFCGRMGKGKTVSQETRDKISASRRGKPHPHRGVPRTMETRLKISLSKKCITTPETLAA